MQRPINTGRPPMQGQYPARGPAPQQRGPAPQQQAAPQRGGFRFNYVPPNPDRVRERANRQGSGFIGPIRDDVKVYKVKNGRNRIRILPAGWENPEHYGIPCWVHYNVGPDGGTIVCNDKQYGERCAICDYRADLSARGDTKAADELKPNERCFVYILDRTNEAEGVQVLNVGWTVDRDIQKICIDSDGSTIAMDDPYNGFDLIFDKSGDQLTTRYSGLQLDRRPTQVDEKYLQYIVQNPLPNVVVYRGYDEQVKINGGMTASAEPDDPYAGGQPPHQGNGQYYAPESAEPVYDDGSGEYADQAEGVGDDNIPWTDDQTDPGYDPSQVAYGDDPAVAEPPAAPPPPPARPLPPAARPMPPRPMPGQNVAPRPAGNPQAAPARAPAPQQARPGGAGWQGAQRPVPQGTAALRNAIGPRGGGNT